MKLNNKEVLSSAEKTPVTWTSVALLVWVRQSYASTDINRAQLALAGGSPSLHMPPRSACARKICRWRRFAVGVCYTSREHGVCVCVCVCLCSVHDNRCSTVRDNIMICLCCPYNLVFRRTLFTDLSVFEFSPKKIKQTVFTQYLYRDYSTTVLKIQPPHTVTTV